MKTFNIEKEPYDKGIKIFSKNTVTLEPGVTVLVGCNGYGKSTFIKTIKRCLDNEKIKYVSYDNLHDGGFKSISKALFDRDYTFGATAYCSSEGENIMMNIGKIAGKIGDYIRCVDQNEYFILLDAVDSGFSVDNIEEVKIYLFKTILDDCTKQNKTVYIIVSANEYEMCLDERCFDIYNGVYKEFKTYNAYRNFILRTRKIKDKRYNKD